MIEVGAQAPMWGAWEIFSGLQGRAEEEVRRLLDGDPVLLERENNRRGRPLAWAAVYVHMGSPG